MSWADCVKKDLDFSFHHPYFSLVGLKKDHTRPEQHTFTVNPE